MSIRPLSISPSFDVASVWSERTDASPFFFPPFSSLGTLTILLQRVPHLVRPFQPQLQRTFVKSLSDTASISIRNSAAEGLGVLMVSQTRVDRESSLLPSLTIIEPFRYTSERPKLTIVLFSRLSFDHRACRWSSSRGGRDLRQHGSRSRLRLQVGWKEPWRRFQGGY